MLTKSLRKKKKEEEEEEVFFFANDTRDQHRAIKSLPVRLISQ
jgi:hypothetical protein